MKYMLIHCVDESLELSADEVTEVEASLASWIEDTVGRGVNLHGSRLQPTSDATTRIPANTKSSLVQACCPQRRTKAKMTVNSPTTKFTPAAVFTSNRSK